MNIDPLSVVVLSTQARQGRIRPPHSGHNTAADSRRKLSKNCEPLAGAKKCVSDAADDVERRLIVVTIAAAPPPGAARGIIVVADCLLDIDDATAPWLRICSISDRVCDWSILSACRPVFKQGRCADIRACVQDDTGRLSNPAMNQAAYDVTQTYGLPVVYPKNFGVKEDVNKLPPEAGLPPFRRVPVLTIEEANQILTATEGLGGRFPDDGSSFGVYSRLNLYAASSAAMELANQRAAQTK